VIVILIGIFLSIIFIMMAVLYVIYKNTGSPEQTIAKRVNAFYKEEKPNKESAIPYIVRDDQLSDLGILNRLLERLDISTKLQRFLTQAGSTMKVGQLIILMAVLGMVGLLLSLIIHNILVKFVFFFVFASFPLLQIYIQRQNRLKAFIRGFPDALDMMTSAIRAGHALNQALQLVGQEAPDPVGIEFKRTFEQHNLGLNLREALLNLSQRLDSLDLKLFVTAILLQKETGGNLTEILENISYTIRERFKLIGQIKTYTAQGRMSAWLLGTLPIIFVGIISVLNPDYLTPLFQDKIGHYLIMLAAVLQVVGFMVIRKIVQIRYQ